MDTAAALEDHAEVTRYARLLLLQAGVGDRLPTPVDDIVACARLVVSGEITLAGPHAGFFSRRYDILATALKKVLGLVDLRENVIYLDTTVLPQRRAFVKLHETGHKVLPWQRHAYLYLDDETTLDPAVKLLFEREANCFAADVLFQIDRFEREARDLPLALRSPLALAKRYGASTHAAIRRYIERHHRACAVLIVERLPDVGGGPPCLRVKRVVQSQRFEQRFGQPAWPGHFGLDHPFTQMILGRRRLHEDGELALIDAQGRQTNCAFHLFDSTYSVFILIYPLDEHAAGKVRIEVVR